MFTKMAGEFREFINRGNVIDLAVAVVIGAAFTGVVQSFTDDLLGQLLAAVGGEPNFDQLVLTLRTVTDASGVETSIDLRYGAFLTALLNFVIVAFAMFLVVKAYNHLQDARRPTEEADEPVESELDVLRSIRDSLASSGGGADHA